MSCLTKPLPADQEQYVTGAELARTLGANNSSVTRWRKDGMPYTDDDGKLSYPLSRCIHWWKDNQVKQATDRTTPDDLDDAKARKESANAAIQELKLAEMKGELITLDAATDRMLTYLTAIAAVLTNAEGKSADQFVNKTTVIDSQLALSKMFRAIRTEIDMNLGVGKSAEFTFTERRTRE